MRLIPASRTQLALSATEAESDEDDAVICIQGVSMEIAACQHAFHADRHHKAIEKLSKQISP